MPDNTLSTLTQIRNKARRLTRSLDTNLLPDATLDEYINTFILYDFPEHLRLFNLHTTLSFYTSPFIDTYSTTSTPTTDPLYNFKNRYISVNPPVYVAGFEALFSQSREQFFAIYPMLSSISSIGVSGDGTTTSFSGTINTSQANTSGISGQTICLLRNNVLFDSIDANYNALTMTDYPISASIGNLRVPDQAPTSTSVQDPANYINYITGQFVVTFKNTAGVATAPAAGQPINSQTVPQQPARPQSILFYDGSFTLRPVPDQSYKVTMEVYQRPTELLSSGSQPELSEWWQFIAYGAAIKILQDRTDTETVVQLMPEFNNQMNLIQRRTIVQNTTQRTSTIYSQQTSNSGAYGPGWGGWGPY